MAKSRRLEVLITGDAKRAQKALGDLERAAGKHGAGIQRASSGIKDAIVGIGVASVGAFALNEWEEAEKVGARTEAVLRSTGGAAGETRQEIEDLSEAISKKTATDDESVQSAANVIASMQKLRNEAGEGRDIFDRSTQAAVDWAAATGGDAADAAEKLGKLLATPEQALGRLTRAGVVFTDEEKKKLAALQATGDEIGQQVILLDAIERKVGGTAEAQATSLDRAKVAAGNAAEAFGGVLAPAVELVADVVEPLSGAFSELDAWQQKLVVGAGAGIGVWARWGDEIGSAASLMRGSVGSARDLYQAIDGLAATRGVSRTTAAFEVLKTSIDDVDLTGFQKGLAGAAAGAGAFATTLAVLNETSDFDGQIGDLAADLELFAKGSGDADRALSELNVNTEDLAKSFKMAYGNSSLFDRGIGMLSRGAIGDTASEINRAQSEIQALDEALVSMVESGHATEAEDAFERIKAELIAQGVATDDVVGYLDDYAEALDRSKRQNIYTETGVGVLTDALAEEETQVVRTHQEFKTLAERIDEARQATVDFYRDQFEQSNATIAAEADLDSLTTSIWENGKTLNENTEAGRANKQALLDYVTSAAAASVGSDDAASSMQAYTMRLAESMMQAGWTKDEVDWLLHSMNLTPEDIHTNFASNATEEAGRVQGLFEKVASVEGVHDVTFRINTVDGLRQARDIIGGVFAEGGRPPMGKVSVVGEKGPELFVPDQPGTIIPNDKMGSFLAPSYSSMVGPGPNAMAAPVAPITIIVQGSVISERELVDVVADGLARRQRSTGNLGFGVPASTLVL